MAKATIYARSDKEQTTDTGATTVPIYLRITHKGQRARMSLNFRIKVSDWNKTSKRIRSSHQQSEYLNQYLSDVQSIADDA